MGLKYIYQGQVYDESAFQNPAGGSARLNIKTGSGKNDVAKYGFTSDVSASQYCKMTFKLNGQKVWLGRTQTVSSANSYQTSSVSNYNTTRQSTYTDWRGSWYTATGTNYTYSHTYTSRTYDYYTRTTTNYTSTYTTYEEQPQYGWAAYKTYMKFGYYSSTMRYWDWYGQEVVYTASSSAYAWPAYEERMYNNQTSSWGMDGRNDHWVNTTVFYGDSNTPYPGSPYTLSYAYETHVSAYGSQRREITGYSNVRVTRTSYPYYSSRSNTYQTNSSRRYTSTSWSSPWYSSQSYTYSTTRTSGYNTTRVSNYSSTRSHNYVTTTSGMGTTHNYNV